MAEGKKPSAAPSAAGPQRGAGLELRLEAGKAFVCLSDRPVAPGVRAVDVAMEVPEVRFPFDVGLGAAQFRKRLCDLSRVDLAVGPEFLASLAGHLDLARAGLSGLTVALRAGFAEGAGRLEGGAPFTFKLGLEPEGDQGLAVVIYDARLYGPAGIPSAALPAMLARAAGGLARPEGASLLLEPLGAVLRRLIPARGWKLPRAGSARLAEARFSPGELRIVWDRAHAGPARAPAEPDRMAALEGARAFRDAEALVARGEWDAAREAYLAAGSAATAHPFAASRLLSLFVIDERFHDEALDLSAHWRSRRPDFAPALVAEGVLRSLRQETARAAAAFADLAQLSAKKGEELGALAAADACFEGGPEADPAAFARAVEVALSVRRDHLPALRALLALSERTGDREALLRASRRLAAYAPGEAEKASAHARLAEMLLKTDPPSARLHLDQALRLAPDDAAALAALARACEEAGEYLRAVRAHDRLRELCLARGDTAGAARSALAVGVLWEERLGHPENALLRYREASDLAPGSPEPRERAARAADALGHWAEAADHYAGLMASLDLGAPGAAEIAARAHRALAAIAETRLGDPTRAASHLEAALAAEPGDAASLERLAALYRTLRRPAELLGTLDELAPRAASTAARAALLAEAGDLCLGPLGLPDAARSHFAAALANDPQCRAALEGMARIASVRGDAHAEREVLSRLVLLSKEPAEEASLYDRLARACEKAGDLSAAARAAASARRAEPSLVRLGESVRVARLARDAPALADHLAELATASRAAGDAPGAVAALVERATLLAAESPALALGALAEARALAPGDPAVLRAQADVAEAAGDPLLALSGLRALLVAGAPDAPRLELRAARVARAAGDVRASREHAERALSLGEASAADLLAEILEGSDDHASRAALLERAGRFLEAARLWERAGGAPERLRAALARASADPASADEALSRLAEARLTAGDRPGAAEALVRLARLRGGAEAVRLGRQAVETDPSCEEAIRLLLEPGPPGRPQGEERASLLGQLAALPRLPDAEVAAALVERARLLASGGAAGGRAEALVAAREAVRRAPRLAEALDVLADLAAREGEPAECARALLERAALSRDAGEDGAAGRLAAAGQAAVAAGLAEAGQEALWSALRLGLDRDEARAAWVTLAERARERGDAGSERAALSALVPLLRTGERPALLLRLSSLQVAAGDLGEARRAAEEARALAPKDPAAVEACRSVAESQGDLAAAAERLADLAAIDPDHAGERLLAQARLLAGPVGRPEEADKAFAAALSRLAPDAALASEHVRMRREAPPPVRDLPWAAPLEAFAHRAPDARAAAVALRDAAYLALAQEDPSAALRCARKAWARTREEPAFAGPLLARVLYRQGGGAEALVLHRGLFEARFPGIDEGEVAVLCRQLAELAEDAGEMELALAALNQLVDLRPQDLEAAEWRFRIDPDRARAVRSLADLAGANRSARRRSHALALAADGAHRDLADPALADALWRRARTAAGDYPALLAGLESVRLEAARADYDPASPLEPSELLDALHDAAAAWQAAGDRAAARALLEEAVEIERRHGRLADAAADLRALEEAAAIQGDAAGSAAYARSAGLVLAQRGDLTGAEQGLRRAVSRDRGDDDSWTALEKIALSRGEGGAPLLAEALAARAERAEGRARADILVRLARVLSGPLGAPDRAAAALQAALAASPDLPGADVELERLYRASGRGAELARLLLERAASAGDAPARTALRREAVALLELLPGEQDRSLAAETALAALADVPGDLPLTRSAARMLAGLGRREEAVPHLAALVRADPDDEASAGELAAALAGRHRERAELFLQRAEGAKGPARAARLREAAKALFAAGEDVRARALLRDAFEAWPAEDGAFLAAIRDAAADIDRLDAVLSARARAVPAEAAGCHRARGDALLAFGRVEEALAAFEACLAVAPDDAGALAMIADIRAEHEGEEAAAASDARLVALADAAPGSVPGAAEARARYRIGLAAWARGRPDEGIAHLEKALDLEPDDERSGLAWAALANGHAARGNGARALYAARRRSDRAAALDLPAERLEALEAGAALAAQFGDQGADAAAVLEGLVATRVGGGGEPDAALDALIERAIEALLRCGENARAEAVIALAARNARGARRADLLSRLADAAQARGDREAARAARTEALAAAPNDATLRAARLADLGQSGDAREYADALEEALGAQGPTAELLLELARARTSLGDPYAATQAYASLVQLGPAAPGYEEASRELAAHLRRAGDARALAASHARRAEEADGPGARALEFLQAATVLEEAATPPEEVRDALDRACQADPDEVPAWKALAAFESRRGEPLAAARAHLAVAIRASGEEAERAALEAARIFEECERPNDASLAFSAALHARPGSPTARRALAMAALARNDAAAATGHLDAIDPALVPPEERLDLLRLRARALEAEGRTSEAEAAWQEALQADPADEEAFDHLAPRAREGGRREEWLALAARHDAALAASGNAARRRDLRCERAEVFTEMGRLEAAEGAWRAALDIDPGFAPAVEALAALAARSEDWAEAAKVLGAAAEGTSDPTEAAAFWLRRGRLLLERLSDAAGAARALEHAVARADAAPDVPAASRVGREAEQLLATVLPGLGRRAEASAIAARLVRGGARVGPEVEALAGETRSDIAAALTSAPEEMERTRDPVADVLRAQAESAHGEERAGLLERLGGYLERAGDRNAAADAILAAVEADPSRELTFAWFLSLAEGDPRRLEAGHRLRARTAPDAVARGAALAELGALLAADPGRRDEAEEALAQAVLADPANASAAEALLRLRAGASAPPASPAETEAVVSFSEIPSTEAEPEASVSFSELASAAPGAADLTAVFAEAAMAAAPPEPTVWEPAAPAAEPASEAPPPQIPESLEFLPEPGGGPEAIPHSFEFLLAPAPTTGPAPTPEPAAAATPAVIATEAPTGVPPPAPPPPRTTLSEPWSGGPIRPDVALARTAAQASPSDAGLQDAWAAAAEAEGALEEARSAWAAALAADPLAAASEAARRYVGHARALEALGRADEAIEALAAARSLGPDGDAAVPDLTRLLKASGRASAEEGELEIAYARLKQAREVDPSDLELARELSRVSERLGHLEEAVVLEELCADAVAAGDPSRAAAAYRRCAELLRDRLGDAERAAVLLEKAVSLAPDDGRARAELADMLDRRRDGAERSLEEQLERARLDLGDADALGAVAAACRQLASSETDPRRTSALVERARAAESIARFVSPGFPAPESPPLAPRVSPEIRSRVAVPGAEGPVGRLVALLAPYLEPLFPADLARRGVGPADRVGSASAPALLGRLDSASRALEARPVALFLAPQGGCQVLLENTQPPSMVVGAGALALSPGALSFLLARALHLCGAGWALAGKFAPRDVAILCELACRFAGGEPPAMGLPAQRAGAFLEALHRSVPDPIRSWASTLAAACTDELAGLDPRAFGAAVQRTASRVALLYTGDAHGALVALAALDPEAAADPVQALQLPDLRDVALFALSDLYLELRVLLVG